MAKRKTATKDVPLAERPIEEVWAEYKKTGTEEIRNFLMERFLPLVRYNAERIHTKLPSEVDVEDLRQAGIFGLMDAIDSFDLTRGVKFETYCAPRIRGAILDELRGMDWVPRLVRSRTAKVEGARKQLEMRLGRDPSAQEIAAHLNVNMEEYEKMAKDSGPTSVVSLNRKWYETDSNKDVREVDVHEDGRQINPFVAVQKQDLKDLITRGLTRAERLIVVLYYYEEMTMKEIGVTLDLSESRVSQMHSSIVARLKAQMQHRSKELNEEQA
jgi:RNA polymerase sigma factor for flagellar operon FliA